MSVQRYTNEPFGAFAKCGSGDYVLHSDYAALEARCAGLERERDELKATMKTAQQKIDNACADRKFFNHGFDLESKAHRKCTAERDALQAKLAKSEDENDGYTDLVTALCNASGRICGQEDYNESPRELILGLEEAFDEQKAKLAAAEDQLATIHGLAFDAQVDNCGKDYALEYIRNVAFGDTTLPHPGRDWRKRAEAAEEALRELYVYAEALHNNAIPQYDLPKDHPLAKTVAILAGHAPATKGEGDD